MAASLLFLLLGGVIADRLPRRLVMVGVDGLRALAVLGLAATQGHVPLTVLTALTFLVGSGEAFFEPSYGALLPAVVPADLLTSANAVSSVSRRVASIAGPALAGIILVAAGSGAAFLLNGLTFAVNMVTLLLLREPARNRQAEPMSMLGEVVEGVQALRARPWVAAMIGVGTLQLFLVVAPETVLLPVVAREHLGGNQAYALTLSAAAVGGLLGVAARPAPRAAPSRHSGHARPEPDGLGPTRAGHPVLPELGRRGVRTRRLRGRPLPHLLDCRAATRVPPTLLGRVTSLDYLGSLALLPVGYALTGPAVQTFGATPVLATAVVLGSVPNLLLLLVPGVAELRSPSSPGGQADQPSPAQPSQDQQAIYQHPMTQPPGRARRQLRGLPGFQSIRIGASGPGPGCLTWARTLPALAGTG